MFPLQIVKFFMVESEKAAAVVDQYQWTLLSSLNFQIYLDAKDEMCVYV